MTLDQNTANKAPGDPVRSADWNDLAAAVLRHETGKLDISGGTMTGLLTAQGGLTASALSSQSLGVQLLKPDNGQANFDNIGDTGTVRVINQKIQLQTPTKLLLIGHGHGTTADPKYPLRMFILVDGKLIADAGNEWGFGHLAVPEGTWANVTAISCFTVDAGSRTVELVASVSSPGTASLHAPTLWVIGLGAF
ncbi:hypothetical protein [Streptomyces sp. NPDC048277]|uniref:hypothetical protein n=1 Tax=Streptomyces sp. NPDC048277 TaxID=3155027 RepID=UPI0033F7B80A